MAHLTSILRSEHPANEIEQRCRASKEKCGISSVLWLTTFNCNLRCSHCYTASPRELEQLTTSEAVQFIEHLGRLRVPLVFLSGGEPFLRDDMEVLLKKLHEVGIRTVISTNGTLVTPQSVKLMKDTGVAYVAISLHGSPETHEEITCVPGTFKMVAQAIEMLKEKAVPVCLKTTVTRRTYDDITRVLEFGIQSGVKAFYLCDLIPAGRGCATAELGENVGTEGWATLLDKLLGYIHRDGIFIDIGAHPSTVALTIERVRAQDKKRARGIEAHLAGKDGICPAGKGAISVMPNGAVTPCNFMPGMVLGNLRSEPIEEISRTMSAYFGNKPLGEPCRSCRWASICGGCRAKAYYLCGDAREGDPTCLIHRNPEQSPC